MNCVSEQGQSGILWTVFEGAPFSSRRIASFADDNDARAYLRLTDALDMQRDEFKRIMALSPSSEIAGICKRAITVIEQTVPVVIQRDNFQKDKTKLRNALAELVGADGADLDGMEALIRISPHAPDEDRAVTINAIHALRETQCD